MPHPPGLPKPGKQNLALQAGTKKKKKVAPATAGQSQFQTFTGLLAGDVTRRQEGQARGLDIKEAGIEHLLAARGEAAAGFEGLALDAPRRAAPAPVGRTAETTGAPKDRQEDQEGIIRQEEKELLEEGVRTPPAEGAEYGTKEKGIFIAAWMRRGQGKIQKEYAADIAKWREDLHQWQERARAPRSPNITFGPPPPRPEMPESFESRMRELERWGGEMYARKPKQGISGVTKAAGEAAKPTPAKAAPAAVDGAPTMREDVAAAAEKTVETVRDEINLAQSNIATLRREILGELFDTSSQKVEELRQGLDNQLNQTIDQIIASGKDRGLSRGDMDAQVAQARMSHGSQLYSLSTQAGANYVQQRTTIQTNFANLSNQISQIGISSVTQVAGIGLTGESFAIQNAAKLTEQARQFNESLDRSYKDLALSRESAKQANLLAYDRLLLSGMDNLADWASNTISFSPIYAQLMNFYSEGAA